MPTVLTQSVLVFRRALRLSLRRWVWAAVGVVQPLIYLCLFGPLLKSVKDTPGFPKGDPWQVFVPGLLVQLGIFGTAFVGFMLLRDMREGILERERVTPASRAALLIGRVMRDVVVLVFQSVVLLAAGVAMGLRAPVWAMAAGVAIVAVMAASISSLSYLLAVTTADENTLASSLNMAAVPLVLLSGILLPMTLAPDWLQSVSDANPLKYIVDGVRALFLHGSTSDVLVGAAVAVGLMLLSGAMATRAFQRDSA